MSHSLPIRGNGLALGVDGGGTKAVAAVAGAGAKILGRAVAGPSNPTKVGLRAAKREILRAVKGALRHAGVGRRGLDAVCLGLAGADRPGVHDPVLRWLRRTVPARAHLVTTDAAIALEAALGKLPGIVVIAGTGSIAYARDERGRVFRAGGWGIPFGDQGSGYDLGRRGVSAALRAHDGEGPATRLEAALCRALHAREITEVVGRNLSARETAALAPVVLEAARQGDPVARALGEEAASHLASLALTLWRRLRRDRRRSLGARHGAEAHSHPIAVICAGGVFQSSRFVLTAFSRQLGRNTRGRSRGKEHLVRVSLLRRAPVEGALALARSLARREGRDGECP